MRIVIAPDSFKGALDALNVARAIARGLLRAGLDNLDLIPVADGGEGTVDALLAAMGGEKRHITVTGPMGVLVDAVWGISGGTAILEMAAASGLPLVPDGKRDVLRATTYGTGELIRAALDAGCRRILLGIGGSATNDGGAGMAQALGARFLDADGHDLPWGGRPLGQLAHIDISALDPRLSHTEIAVACDVRNPLCGPEGASHVYGPQKGATPAQAALLDENLRHYAALLHSDVGRDVLDVPGAGAAGGLGGGLMALLSAKLQPGFALVAREARMEERIAAAGLAITGEGCTDAQTAMGKVPAGVATIARAHGIKAICLSGALRPGYEALYDLGMTACFALAPGPITLQESMAKTAELLEARAYDIGRMVAQILR